METVDSPKNRKIISCKWVYKIKQNADGSVARYKARLVAQGFSQVERVDNTETFAPVTRFTSFRVVLALAAKNGWHLEQTDVSNAFLNIKIEEELYMAQPRGFESPGPRKVCKILKGLYGFKQRPRYWNIDIHKCLVSDGFKQSKVGACMSALKRE